MRRKALSGFLGIAFVLVSTVVCQADMGSGNYRISRSVLSGGGGFMVSESYVIGSTLGQASGIGPSSSATYSVQAGFWISILMKGDLNGDREVDLADLVLSLQVLTGMSPAGLHRGADVDADGQIGLTEAIYILGKAAGLR